MVIIFTVYIGFVSYLLVFQPKEKRFHMAASLQGYGLSQSMFDILNWQYPGYSDAYFERSVAFNKCGEYETGFNYLDQAVELEPMHHLGYRGHLKLRFLRDYKAALTDFDRLDMMTPEMVDAPWGEDIDFLRGECYYGLGEYQRALQYFEQSVVNQGADWVDVQAFVYQGLCHYQLENYEHAILAYKKGLVEYDTTCEAYFGLAETYLKVGDTINAKHNLKKAQESLKYKRNDPYKEFLNEIYEEDLVELSNKMLGKL